MSDPITNTAAVEADPCSAIPAGEIEAIGGKVKRFDLEQLSMGNACAWVFAVGANTVSAGGDHFSFADPCALATKNFKEA
ncbi:hypothetical protein [Amycolatopsis alba]|uniref:hypothetical protein n=1 Tax=Amycolatopsis alba TaxID=76020 RepID=UPI0003709E72|nr:hypothetical protein [Amycolatopsis alba]